MADIKKRYTFLEGFKHNFNMLVEAASNGDLALMEVRDRATGQLAASLVVANRIEDTDEIEFLPVGTMCAANPYEMYDPPSQDGEQEFHAPDDAERDKLVAQLHNAESQVWMLRKKLGLPDPVHPHPSDEPEQEQG